MAKKIMLWPSARSKFITDKNMKLIYNSLLVLSVVMVLLNYYMYSFMYGVKLALMILVSIIATKEMEILFYTHDKDISRAEAKTLIEKSYPKVTALLYVLLIPIGTPLWLVGLGAVLATLLGKLLFGGFHHMIFHTSIVGVVFVTMGWPALVGSVDFMTSFDNYLLNLMFNNPFFNETLAIGGLYDPTNSGEMLHVLSWLSPVANDFSLAMANDTYSLGNVVLGLTPGIIGSGIVILGIFGFLLFKKAVNYVTPVATLGSFLVVTLIYVLVNDLPFTYILFQLFAGSFLFVVVFISTDPITTPIDTRGKIIFGVLVGALTIIIRLSEAHEEGVYFAILFMMMLTPMLNQGLKPAQKKKVAPKKEAV